MSRALTFVALLAGFVAACEPARPSRRLDPETERKIAAARATAGEDPEALRALGALELEAGQLFQAAETFEKAKTLGLSTPELYAGRSETYRQLGYARASMTALRECFLRDREQPDCLATWALLLEPDGSEGAQKEIQRTWARFMAAAPADHPKRAYAQSSLDQLNARFGPPTPRTPPPGAATSTAAASNPHAGLDASGDVGQLNPFGQALQGAYRAWAEERFEDAVKGFQTALELNPEDAPTLAELGRALLDAGRGEEAIAAVERAYALDPKDAQTRFGFGWVLLKQRTRPEEALAAWRALAADDPEYARERGIEQLLRDVGELDAKTATTAPVRGVEEAGEPSAPAAKTSSAAAPSPAAAPSEAPSPAAAPSEVPSPEAAPSEVPSPEAAPSEAPSPGAAPRASDGDGVAAEVASAPPAATATTAASGSETSTVAR